MVSMSILEGVVVCDPFKGCYMVGDLKQSSWDTLNHLAYLSSAYSHQNLQIGFVLFYLASWFMYNTTEQESARTVGIFLQLASN